MRIKISNTNDTYCVSYLGDNYKIHPGKVFLDNKKPTIILNPFTLDVVHEPILEQWGKEERK